MEGERERRQRANNEEVKEDENSSYRKQRRERAT